MLLVFGVQNLLAKSIYKKESCELSKSENWKGYKFLFVRPGHICTMLAWSEIL